VVTLLAVFGILGKNLARERGSLKMEEKQIATIGSSCLNERCEDYQKVNHGNMIKHGKTDTGVQRYRCKTE
jgi:transposase-like protein